MDDSDAPTVAQQSIVYSMLAGIAVSGVAIAVVLSVAPLTPALGIGLAVAAFVFVTWACPRLCVWYLGGTVDDILDDDPE